MSHRTSANSTSRRALTPEELAGEYRRKAEKAQEKLDAANRDGIQQKAEIARLQRQLAEISEAQKGSKKSITTLKDACTQLEYERDHWKSEFVRLEASYDSLKLKYEAIPQEQRKRNPMVSTIPDRSKRPPTASSSGSNGSGSMSSRARQQEAERLERAKREAEDARLGARFERSDRGSGTSSTARRPTTNGHSRRESFIEGYGSRKPSGRVVFDDVAHTSRYDEPVLTPRDPHVVYSHMPRTVPASSVGYHSGGSSAIVDDEFEDGNYHLRPVQ